MSRLLHRQRLGAAESEQLCRVADGCERIPELVRERRQEFVLVAVRIRQLRGALTELVRPRAFRRVALRDRCPEEQRGGGDQRHEDLEQEEADRKSTRLNSSHRCISYAVFCLKKKT